ncbi:UvrD-helicase domain-containing protein [Shewanella sp. SM32]|uniref:UvrD-helicase domain-containing protein n=1 Tax=Shewanella sp. SM32 TaxID=2912796 RepID=UPI0021D8713E|nr:UvrD-helicase domain-containing protein [Shewanella sp. SM32]MCU8069147.1 UvrD-helicase domain-containing protein [Shewanella sp. SM32]
MNIEFISAGAGSGKTYTLMDKLYQELMAGTAPSGILATTFTNKAAAELRERVRQHLIKMQNHALANQMSLAQIGTVNSVCGQLLKRFAFEAGMPIEQKVLDEKVADQLMRESIDAVNESGDMAEFLRIAGRLGLADATFGSDNIPWREALKNLINQARSNSIDAATLRQDGARNALDLLRYFPSVTISDLSAQLQCSIEKVLPNIRTAVAQVKPIKLTVSYLQQLETVLSGIKMGQLSWSAWPKLAMAAPEASLKDCIQDVADVAGHFMKHAQLHQDIEQYLTRIFNMAADAMDVYRQLKEEMGGVDFTDQECRLLEILDHPVVADALRDELALLMVDEFQDTSPIQLALFLKLASYAKKVIWVGDIKQAIYGFRGSDPALMMAVIDALPALGGSKSILPNSYRSRPALVHCVNDLFGNAFNGLGLSKADVELVPTRVESEGAALLDWVLEGSNKETIQSALATAVSKLMAEGRNIVDRETNTLRPVRYSDIAILTRSNASVPAVAAALSVQGIRSATEQSGLLLQPECVLATACLRRVLDPADTIATAEIISLAYCQEPEQWLSHRLNWLAQEGNSPSQWIENSVDAAADLPIFNVLKTIRSETLLLSPREALENIILRCQLSQAVLQWQQDVEKAQQRLANLNQLLLLATKYEDDCLSANQAATLTGLLMALHAAADEEIDLQAQTALNAVNVLTHHRAKGLEWPVVILMDLASDVRDRLWGVQTESAAQFDATTPLSSRKIRYWPWPFGAQKKVTLADEIAQTPLGKACRQMALNEEQRLLYVSMTRARDVLILARSSKTLDGEWMQTIALADILPADDTAKGITLKNQHVVPFERAIITSSAPVLLPNIPEKLYWFAPSQTQTDRQRMSQSPSTSAATNAVVLESEQFGVRLATGKDAERGRFGDVIHACFAAHLADRAKPLCLDELAAILVRTHQSHMISAPDLYPQMESARQWLLRRWPDGQARIELPMAHAAENGTMVAGRADLVIETTAGFILIDYKSTSVASIQHAKLVQDHGGQLATYANILSKVTGKPVIESWLMLPMTGIALRLGAI